jgi:catechol 2,3-dioxygenase
MMDTMEYPQPIAISPHRIDPATLPGYVQLKVADLENQLVFYQTALGMQVNWQDLGRAGLGIDGRDLVRLLQTEKGHRYRGVTGLYHFAVLFPDRRELAKAVARLFRLNWANSPTDHVMTKTTYLDDPEGNTIELYCESPEDGVFMMDPTGSLIARHADGRPSDGREPLDLDALFAHVRPDDRLDGPLPLDTRLGHFHLYVSDLAETRSFYHEKLGFDDMGVAPAFRMGMVSAGGYHHHIGYNTWQGEGASPAPPDAVGLDHFAFYLSQAGELDRLEEQLRRVGQAYARQADRLWLQDPSGNVMLLTTSEMAAVHQESAPPNFVA